MKKLYAKRIVLSCFIIMVMLLSACGSKAEVTNDVADVTTTEAVIEEKDTTGPVLELATDTVAYYEGDKYDPMVYVATATDDSGDTVDVQYNDDNVNIATPGDYIITYTATDSAGNSTEKKLNFKVKKEYSRDEIKDIIKKLIDEKYYEFNYVDFDELNPEEYFEGYLTSGTIEVSRPFEEYVTDAPESIWPSDTDVFTMVEMEIFINSSNYGIKNTNSDTINSELIIRLHDMSGETEVSNYDYVEIFSDSGKIKIDTIYFSQLTNKQEYYKKALTLLCFDSENSIKETEAILNSNNTGIKLYKGDEVYKTFTFSQNQRDHFLKIISFYHDLNEYVNNKPKTTE